MTNRLGKVLFLSSVLWSSVSIASSISLVPSGNVSGSGEVTLGEDFTLDLVLDASGADKNGLTLLTPAVTHWYNGDIGIVYDPAKLTFIEAVSSTSSEIYNPSDPNDPIFHDVNAGVVTFAFSNLTSPDNIIATYHFTATAAGTTDIFLSDTNPLGSLTQHTSLGGTAAFFPFVSDLSLNVSASAIPVPASLWLLFSGIGLLVRFSKKQRH